MPQYKDKILPSGGLNLDNSVENLTPGDYPDALDVSFLSDFTGGSNNITPKLGNEYAFDIGSVSAQNKKYRLYIDLIASGTLSYEITFYKTDTTTVLFTASFTNGLLSAADTAISGAAAAAGYGINITNNGVFLLIEFAPMSGGVQTNYYDYFINDTGADALESLYVYQEAIDLTLVGENRVIGSFDLLGDLFIWSTSQTELPSDLGVTISSIRHTTVLTNITIDFSAAHGLNTGERILVQGVEVLTGANGYWIVVATSATQIQLAMSESVPQLGQIFSGLGLITINPSGIGEIGVAQKIQSTQAWQYRRLLRSKEWNWNTKKQFDTYCEETATNKNLYGTNDYTPPMVFYYQTAYSQDGALSFNGGLYEYGTIFDETRLFLSVLNTQIEFTEQLQGGGALTAGNKRYAVRALTETATATDWSDVTNPVNVYAASTTGSPEKIIGDVAGALTAKINVLTITNIQPDIFKYVEVACIEYAGLAVSGYIINRYIITGDTLEINHTGNETTSQLDINEIQTFSIPINTAKNIRAIDNRMILSNITTVSDEDLSAVATAIRHSVVRKSIHAVGDVRFSGITLGEYQVPENVNESVGYMINETYRFSFKLRHKNSAAWTKNYWIDDIRVDDYIQGGFPYNRGNPFGDNRRDLSLADLMITDDTLNGGAHTASVVYVPYIEFTNIDFNYILDNGLRLGDFFDAIAFERAECKPQVLFCGIARMGVHDTVLVSNIVSPRPPIGIIASNPAAAIYIDYNLLPLNAANPPDMRYNYTLRRKYMAIYSPDILLGNLPYTHLTTDEILNYGNPEFVWVKATGNIPFITYVEFIGQFANSYTTHSVSDAKQIPFGGNDVLSGVPFYNQEFQIGDDSTTACLAAESGTDLLNNSSYRDMGYYYIQYYRSQIDPYGDITQTQYISCQSIYETASTSSLTSFDVLGGDTFTQKTYFKTSTNNGNSSQPAGFTNDGIGFYSQNRINSQMRQALGGLTQKVFPVDAVGTTFNAKIDDWLGSGFDAEYIAYDTGYNIINGIDYHIAFDPNLIPNDDQPTRIRWSPVKPQNAIADLYRAFLPLDFHDLDNSFGEITHHENVNGELFTLQPKKWQRQYFNTRGTLDVRGVSDVLIGDGSVMSRDGQTISNFGCQNKWSVIKGKSQGGNDTIYWIDLINKQAIRFGLDGTIGLSTIKGLQSFLANNLTWATSNDTPADGQGIHGWWHERYKEAIWVVRATRGNSGRGSALDVPEEWQSGVSYDFGKIVSYDSGTPNDFNQAQTIYRSLYNNNTATPSSVGWWEQIPITDTDYYNYYSVAFNELKNRFTSFYKPLPKIAMQWNNGYLTPRPVGTQSRVYEHNKGDYTTWYVEGVDELTSEAYVDLIYNKDNSLSKTFLAFIATCQSVPYKVTFFTDTHETTSVTIDFKQYPTPPDFATAIQNDVLNTIAPPIGYSKCWGVWVKCRFYFENKTFNSLDGAVIKFTTINPIYQR